MADNFESIGWQPAELTYPAPKNSVPCTFCDGTGDKSKNGYGSLSPKDGCEVCDGLGEVLPYNPHYPQEDLEYVPVKPGANPKPDYYKLGPDGEKIEITRAEYKEYQRKHVTVKYQTIPSCGHKFRPGDEPSERNCDACWFTFFQVHGELTQAADEVFNKFGADGLRQLRGKKFTKNFLAFTSTIAQWKATSEAAAKKEENEQSTSGPGSTDTGVPEGESLGVSPDAQQASLFES